MLQNQIIIKQKEFVKVLKQKLRWISLFVSLKRLIIISWCFENLADIDMLSMVEKGTRDGLCHSTYRYAKVNHKFIKIIIKLKNLKYWEPKNLRI